MCISMIPKRIPHPSEIVGRIWSKLFKFRLQRKTQPHLEHDHWWKYEHIYPPYFSALWEKTQTRNLGFGHWHGSFDEKELYMLDNNK